MPNLQVCEYIKQQTGVDLNKEGTTSNIDALIVAAHSLQDKLGCVLYNAVVKVDGDLLLSGSPITSNQLQRLKSIASLAKNLASGVEGVHTVIQDFEGAAQRYANFLSTSRNFANTKFVTDIINKQQSKAIQEGTYATPRHTLARCGPEVYEILTWMTPKEIARVERRFPNTNGLFSIQSERSRTKEWGAESFVEHKITLGSGSFGAARLARQVSTNQYMVFKKVHPQDVGPKPEVVPVIRGVNDGSLSGVSRVFDSFMAHSTRGGGGTHLELSAFTLSELGVVDAHKFISMFSLMSYALNNQYQSELFPRLILKQMAQGDSAVDTLQKIARLSTNPCSDPEIVRRFRNTCAYQMLRAVQQMHNKDRAHNDIKPDNFVLAYDAKKLLRIKLIDFDLNASVRQSVGKARDVYAAVFSAPQVSSSEVNNQADRNDAYSMGCTLRLLNGEPLEALLLQRKLVKGEVRNSKNAMIKPVEDRRSIESRFSKLPELTTLTDLINLLCHPHSGKRYTITQALESPLFTQSGNLISNPQFSQIAEKIIRQAYLLPKEYILGLGALQQCERALQEELGQPSSGLFGPMAAALTQQDDKLLTQRYIQTHGVDKLKLQMNKAKAQAGIENGFAVLRRGVRQLSIGHHLKTPAEREAGYVYKASSK